MLAGSARRYRRKEVWACLSFQHREGVWVRVPLVVGRGESELLAVAWSGEKVWHELVLVNVDVVVGIVVVVVDTADTAVVGIALARSRLAEHTQ